MTKELSKQLCELCGITRKYCKKCGSRGYIGERYIKEDIFECCMCHCKDFELKANSDIDCGEPENFVKLQEILTQNDILITYGKDFVIFDIAQTWYWGKDEYEEIISNKGLISTLILLLGDYNCFDEDPNYTGYQMCVRDEDKKEFEKIINYVKQSIREAEWKYE